MHYPRMLAAASDRRLEMTTNHYTFEVSTAEAGTILPTVQYRADFKPHLLGILHGLFLGGLKRFCSELLCPLLFLSRHWPDVGGTTRVIAASTTAIISDTTCDASETCAENQSLYGHACRDNSRRNRSM